MKWLTTILASMALCWPASMLHAQETWKVRMDPVLALASFPNLEVDRAISPNLSVGAMIWHFDDGWFNSEPMTSIGMRLDWFENGVFDSGWHTNLILKGDFLNRQLERTRIKGTQTYQWSRNRFHINAGIGLQFIVGGLSDADDDVYVYDSWVYPAWELSIGRSF